VPAKAKLSDDQVKAIRRRARSGEHLTDLAHEFGVNRKTIRRRLDALARAETERADRSAAKRLRSQAARERRKLLEREHRPSPKRRPGRPQQDAPGEKGGAASQPGRKAQEGRERDPFLEWLDRTKNLSGRAFADARGLVRVRNPEGTLTSWRERAEVEAFFEAGWTLA
jgi:hypothetical protein